MKTPTEDYELSLHSARQCVHLILPSRDEKSASTHGIQRLRANDLAMGEERHLAEACANWWEMFLARQRRRRGCRKLAA